MEVVVANHPSSRAHDTGSHHPERPERVDAVLRGIHDAGIDVVEIEGRRIQRSELALVHDPSYIEMVEHFTAQGGGALDMDTIVCEKSWEAALTAAGGVESVIEELGDHPGAFGFAITRPPGHHAMRDRAMGFCIFNNISVAAARLRSEGERVAILDWDVHHGNGTQSLLGKDPGVLYVSVHESPFYPFEGQLSDIHADAKGTIVNIPVPAGTAGDQYRRAWGEIVIPLVGQFEPDWILISAGYDAHADDPLADLALGASDYGWIASRVAEAHPPDHTVVILEGGYDIEALERSTSATVRGLAGEHPDTWPDRVSPLSAKRAVDAAARAVSEYWKL